ncbi:hypothetical protein [Nocardiopsis oceani]
MNASKTVRMVITEEGTEDPKIQKAIEGGHRVVTPVQAWEVLKSASHQADGNLFEDGSSARMAAQVGSGKRRRQNSAEDSGTWLTCWWPRELTEREYHREFLAPHKHQGGAWREPGGAGPAADHGHSPR